MVTPIVFDPYWNTCFREESDQPVEPVEPEDD